MSPNGELSLYRKRRTRLLGVKQLVKQATSLSVLVCDDENFEAPTEKKKKTIIETFQFFF